MANPEELKKELARVADEIHTSAKKHSNKDTRASDRFVEWASEFKIQ